MYEAKRYLAMSDDELYQIVGQTFDSTLGIKRSPEDDIEAGQIWIEDNLHKLQKRICEHPSTQGFLANAGQPDDDVALFAALVDILAVNMSLIPASTIAVIVMRYGLAKLCHREK